MADKITTDVEVAGGSAGGAHIQRFVDVATASATAVHAALAGTAAVTFPGPITNPTIPRNVTGVFAASYDGGNLTVTGTDQFDAAVVEVIVAVANSTVAGVKIFKTVTSIVKGAVGANGATVSIGTGTKLGLAQHLAAAYGVLNVDNAAPEAGVWDATYHAVTPTTAPNASRDFGVMYPLGA